MEQQEEVHEELDEILATQYSLLEQLEHVKTNASAKKIIEQLKAKNKHLGELIAKLDE